MKKLLLLGVMLCGLVSCQSIPDHQFCMLRTQEVEYVNPTDGQLRKGKFIVNAACSRVYGNEKPVWISAEKLDKWIARSPATEKQLQEWGKRNCSK